MRCGRATIKVPDNSRTLRSRPLIALRQFCGGLRREKGVFFCHKKASACKLRGLLNV